MGIEGYIISGCEFKKGSLVHEAIIIVGCEGGSDVYCLTPVIGKAVLKVQSIKSKGCLTVVSRPIPFLFDVHYCIITITISRVCYFEHSTELMPSLSL